MDGIEFKFEEGWTFNIGTLYAARTSTGRNIGTLYAARTSTGRNIGSLSVYPSKDGMYLHSFGIWDKRNRNKGIGRAMLRWIKEKYKGTKIYLSCAHGNDNALHLYKSEGFKIYEDESWYEMVCDNC